MSAELTQELDPGLFGQVRALPPLHLVRGHAHTWQLVADEYDEFGRVRAFECSGCYEVRYD